jgi:putative hydrolase of the HAD superfamily
VTRVGRKEASALLVSFDGVLWQHDEVATTIIEKRARLTPGTVRATAWAPERVVPAMLGQASRAAWLESTAADLAGQVGSLTEAERIVEDWFICRGDVITDVVTFLADVHAAGVPVAVCATGVDEVPDEVATSVDVVVNAMDVGVAVPHPEFFTTACAAVATAPKDCLYVATAPRLIAGARAAGLLAYRYVGLPSLAYLREVFALAP